MNLNDWGNIAQVLGSATLVYAYFPQIYSLVRYKNADGMNLQFWTILTIALACIGVNLSISGVNYFIQGTQWFNVLLALIVLLLSIKFQKAKKTAIKNNK